MESSRYKVAPYVTEEKRDGNFSMRLCFKLNYNYRLCVRKGIIPSLAKPHRKRFLSAFVQDNVDLLLSQRKLEFTFIRSLFASIQLQKFGKSESSISDRHRKKDSFELRF